MQHKEWCDKYRRLRDLADRICQARTERARKLCREAGLDPGLLGIHPHNAMCDYRQGRPWPNVDYAKVRACLRLLDTCFEGYRIVERWDRRVR